uniref:Uncharacterized protein n=1 Tax=Solibacter usitatus (strain Ellin6076) TaxID=234267 RepID=Q01WX2_SOLUE
MLPNILLDSKTRAPSPWMSAHLHFPGAALARFLELRGRRVVKDCGATWYAGPGRFLMSLPYQATINPDPKELRRMIRETGAFGARFPSATWSGVESGLYVMSAREYDIESVHVKQRRRVRHGLETFHVRPATKAQLLSQGWSLNLSTMARQGRYDPEFGDRRRWETLVEAAFACSEISFPAAFHGGRMAAYMVTCREQRWLHILHQMSRQDDLSHFPNHVLTYEVTRQAASDPDLDAIAYGYVPLCAANGLHEYKLRFGYQLIPHRSAIQLHPLLDTLLNSRLARAAVHAVRCLYHHNPRLETIETVLKGAHTSGPAMPL